MVAYFGHPRDVMQATAGQLTRVTGIGPKIARHYRISGRQNGEAGDAGGSRGMSDRHAG
jgi:hypothetical protein